MLLKAGFRLPSNLKSYSNTYSFYKLILVIMENKNQEPESVGPDRLKFARRNFIAKTVMSMAGLAITPLLFAAFDPSTKITDFSSNGLFPDKGKKKTVLLINAHLKYPGLS